MTEKALNAPGTRSENRKFELWQYRETSARFWCALPGLYTCTDSEKIALEAISFPYVINRLNIVGKRRSNILTSHVEHKRCRMSTSAPSAVLLSVSFIFKTERHIYSTFEEMLWICHEVPPYCLSTVENRLRYHWQFQMTKERNSTLRNCLEP